MAKKINNPNRIPFKVSARTAKLIGLENFSTEEGAIIELVKNTYDADARNCILIFNLRKKEEKIINEKGEESIITSIDSENSSIYVIDNGIGMNDLTIQNQWMTIGTANKLHEHITEGGRVKTGAKGIGRFALNRLGMLTNMTSLPVLLEVVNDENKNESGNNISSKFIKNSENVSFDWMVDWKDFDKENATVSDIEAILLKNNNQNIKQDLLKRFSLYPEIKETIKEISFESGTLIEITELNDEWTLEKLNKLFNNLEMLLPPKEQSDFKIHFFWIDDLNKFGEVKRAYYDDYDYKLKASYKKSEDNFLTIEMIRNELDVSVLESNYQNFFEQDLISKAPYRLEDFKKDKIEFDISIDKLMPKEVNRNLLDKIGDFNFTFYYLKNTISDDSDDDKKKYPYKSFDSASRKSWLKKFGGIKIFRDGFRIRPYGENGDDWLRLGERQAQSPGGAGQRLGGYRIRPNQIAGTINISRIHNVNFQDKSGREGLIENDEFELFKNIIKEIISIFEKDRNTIMFGLSELHKKSNKEAETKRQAHENAKRILEKRERKTEQNEENPNSTSPEKNSKVYDNNDYSSTEENMADAIFILEKEGKKKDEELRLLRSLASVGLVISSFAHEVRSLRARLIPRTNFLISELKNHLNESDFDKIDKDDNPFYMIELMREEDLKLKHWLDYSLSTLKIDKRERKSLEFSKYFENFKAIWYKALEQRNIHLELKALDNEEHIIKAFEVNMDSIFNNLLSNSINAHYGPNVKQKRVEISWGKVGKDIEIIFSDNGKGLDAKYKDNPEDIFNLNESSKTDNKGNKIGTGLGLYIVKSVIEEYNNSSISILKIDGGLSFKITFKALR
ncbi:sensor histidine kinase [Acinetobacter nosocomialis]|uniref:sensor histidine kinase n=1 Tax=Acinetobacter nosocomialis TaxID=106654 RepID=UPI0026F41B11|nr:ATP-binding protein [Acinetobacter nosocomialis]MDO7437756.1 ATP-binding protein [Acinetobacter nosocomialis]